MLKDTASAVPITLALLVVCIRVVGEAGVLHFLGGLGSSRVEGEILNSI